MGQNIRTWKRIWWETTYHRLQHRPQLGSSRTSLENHFCVNILYVFIMMSLLVFLCANILYVCFFIIWCVDIWGFVWKYDPSFLFFCSRIVNIFYVFFCGIYYLSFFAFLLPLSGRSSWSSGAGKFRTVWFCNVGNCFQIKKTLIKMKCLQTFKE